MAYTKNTWQTGDIVTADKLNNMENGIVSNEPLLVQDSANTLSETWQTIYNKMHAGGMVYVWYDEDEDGYISVSYVPVVEVGHELEVEDGYYVVAHDFIGSRLTYATDAANGYPAISGGDLPPDQ